MTAIMNYFFGYKSGKEPAPVVGSCIVVGGGIAGVSVARHLAQVEGAAVDVTVVDRQDYLDYSVASPRMLVDPDKIEEMGYVMPLDKVCEHVGARKDGTNRTKFVQGAVSKITPTGVELESGETLTADAIVVAVGGFYRSGTIWKPTPDQTTKEKRIAAFQRLRHEAASAKSILVKGAGPTGVEVAGELKVAFPGAKVTMVGSLLPGSTEGLQSRTKDALEGMGVIVQDGRVDVDSPDADGNVVTREGVTIQGVDMVLNAAGFVFAGEKLADESLKADLNGRGQFECRPTLQLKSFDTVFACGDILAIPDGYYGDPKGSIHAQATAEAVAGNVVSLLQKETELKPFAWSAEPIQKPIMITLGPGVGIGDMGMPNFIENFLVRMIKCKDFYMSMNGKNFGKGTTW